MLEGGDPGSGCTTPLFRHGHAWPLCLVGRAFKLPPFFHPAELVNSEYQSEFDRSGSTAASAPDLLENAGSFPFAPDSSAPRDHVPCPLFHFDHVTLVTSSSRAYVPSKDVYSTILEMSLSDHPYSIRHQSVGRSLFLSYGNAWRPKFVSAYGKRVPDAHYYQPGFRTTARSWVPGYGYRVL